ncbi:GSCOCT00014307001.2-RA-CDS [Cotesia congregata]|uniref:Cc_vank.9_26.5 n=2 Tax=root TaxID=1 RepID=S6CWQ6_COTCN|nr:hypothetical protein CcBV_26.5 [Bracoviriform congregatae]CAD6244200.1 GSCOCT00014307001.2-RA-CDS [Cotesia congregata]CAG17495.1 hypothetical protein CcBV_26.5 [Bracoviriform congregatae]CAG5094016.1 cc_vank.9_26.5 [Cotesia congregata]CCQ71367.1 viral ankyrin VANK-9 [Cotesia congregata]
MERTKSQKWPRTLSDEDFFGKNFLRPEYEASPLTHLESTESRYMDQPMPLPMTARGHNAEQCTHGTAKCKYHFALAVMRIVLKIGAHIDALESLIGCTPPDSDILEENDELDKWLCERPDINLEATNYDEQTAYQRNLPYKGIPPLNVRRSDRIAKIKRFSPKSKSVSQKNTLKSRVRRLSFGLE